MTVHSRLAAQKGMINAVVIINPQRIFKKIVRRLHRKRMDKRPVYKKIIYTEKNLRNP